MFHLLFLICSYGSFLFFLMSATGIGILTIAVMFALGIAFTIYKKIYEITYWKNMQYKLVIISIFSNICLSIIFYNRWIISSKMQTLATMIRIPIHTMLLIVAIILSIFSSYFCYIVMQIMLKQDHNTKSENNFKKNILSCFIASFITVMLAQTMIEINALSMGYLKFIYGVLIVFVVILLLYCLLGRIMISIFIGSGFFMIIATINVYVYRFRGRLLEPIDFLSMATAMNVVENYSLFPIPLNLFSSWGIFICMLAFLYYYLQNKKEPQITIKKRLASAIVCIICSGVIFFYITDLKTYHWHKESVQNNGYILDFVSKFKEITVSKPNNYSPKEISEIADQYTVNNSEYESSPQKSPHIIVIMDEAFSDLSIDGDFSTNIDVMPFISSLKENTISGYALTSIYGGNTANSEYEFLTGNSLAWLSPNVVPYQQYIRSSTYSMVSHLKLFYDYKCMAMHPFKSSGWNRPIAYEYLGFDECFFVENFPQKNYIRNYISDQEMFEFMIETYEKGKENPLFLFGVTMQNHGGYTYSGENYSTTISLNNYGGEFPEVEQYLSLIHETDKAVEYLIKYFQNVNEDVIVVFFGDHQPKISDAFYEKINRNMNSTLDEEQNRYKVPFFIWANYDIEEKYIDCISLNYLSSYVYNVAGIALPPYNQFLHTMEKNIPAINANGFYSLSNGCYLPLTAAKDEELMWLESYEALQYNNIFDKKNRNEALFPVIE